jgi:hypothetical protein
LLGGAGKWWVGGHGLRRGSVVGEFVGMGDGVGVLNDEMVCLEEKEQERIRIG